MASLTYIRERIYNSAHSVPCPWPYAPHPSRAGALGQTVCLSATRSEIDCRSLPRLSFLVRVVASSSRRPYRMPPDAASIGRFRFCVFFGFADGLPASHSFARRCGTRHSAYRHMGSSMTNTRRYHQLAAAAFMVVALAACGNKQAQGPGGAGMPPTEVGVVTVQPHSVGLTSELPGRLEATRVAQVRARVAGIVLKRTYAEGSDVKAGHRWTAPRHSWRVRKPRKRRRN
jgi:hypothetical protein